MELTLLALFTVHYSAKRETVCRKKREVCQLTQGLDYHGSAEQHYTQVCCNLRQPLQRLHPDEQPKSVLNIVKLMSMHASKVIMSRYSSGMTEQLSTTNYKIVFSGCEALS